MGEGEPLNFAGFKPSKWKENSKKISSKVRVYSCSLLRSSFL